MIGVIWDETLEGTMKSSCCFLCQRYNYVSFFTTGIDIAMNSSHLLEGIASINNRFEFSRLSKLYQKT